MPDLIRHPDKLAFGMQEKAPFVYIMTNRRNGTLYVGVTSNLAQRVAQHREGTFGGFTKKYGLIRLVWFEPHSAMEAAILREKQLKRYHRAWKLELIETQNPTWNDLYTQIAGTLDPGSSPG